MPCGSESALHHPGFMLINTFGISGMVLMPSNKRAGDLVQPSAVCVHHCSGVGTAAGIALDLVITPYSIGLGVLSWYLKVLRYLESSAENSLYKRKWKH